MAQLTARQKFIQVALKYGKSVYGLPKTGQLASYAAFDDGYFRAGYPKYVIRFVIVEENIVRDDATGLYWVRDPSLLGGVWGNPGDPSAMNWADAVHNCRYSFAGGLTDWRLPNIRELESIKDYKLYQPVIDLDYFPNAQFGNYWTSTTLAYLATWAWYIDFWEGYSDYINKSSEFLVRPVRGGNLGT